MSVCVCVRCAYACVCVCVCEWRGEFNRVVLVVQLGLILHFISNPEQHRVFQLVLNKKCATSAFNKINKGECAYMYKNNCYGHIRFKATSYNTDHT
jgi:hypothetical protein